MILIKRPTKLQWQETIKLLTMKAAWKKHDRRNWIIRNYYHDDVDVTETVLMITMQMKRKMSLQIYKQMNRQNPVTKKK